MAKPTDRVQIQKRESAAGGGDAADDSPFLYDPLDSSEDCVELRGVFLQDAGGLKDEDVGIWRDGDDIVFLDVTTGVETTLSGLSYHNALTGLAEDDHPQYLLVDGSRDMTGTLTTTYILTDNGSSSSPAYGFASAPGAGMSHVSSTLRLGVSSQNILQIGTGGISLNKTTTVAGSIKPSVTATYDLGLTGFRWSTLFVDDVVVTASLAVESIILGSNSISDVLLIADPLSTSDSVITSAGYIDTNYARQTELDAVATAAVTDHGALTGLIGTDHHTQYMLVSGTRASTGVQTFSAGISIGGNTGSDILISTDTISTSNLALTTAGYVDARYAAIGDLVTDHGALTGLSDDDHTQYLLADGTRAVSGAMVFSAGLTIGGNVGSDILIGSDGVSTSNLALATAGYVDANYLRDTDAYSHPNHTGDVTSVGDGAQTISANAVTNAKAADMAANTVKVNPTTGTADPSDLAMGASTMLARLAAGNIVAATPTQIRTLINVEDGSNNYVHPNHTGDVTSTGDGATTIANSAVTNAKMANMVATTFKGRALGAGTGAPVDLTATQATAMLNNFSSTLKGLTPLSGGGTTNFLRADGTWAAPPAGTTLDGAYDFGGSGAGRTITVDNGPIEATNNSVGTGSTPAILLVNNTSATSGVQKYSPILELEGQGYSTGFGASQEVKFAMQTKPIQQTLNPTGKLSFLKSVNGAAYSEIATLDTLGSLVLGGNFSAGGGDFVGTLVANGDMVVSGDLRHGDRTIVLSVGLGKNMTSTGSHIVEEISSAFDWRGRFEANGVGNISAIPLPLLVGDRVKSIKFNFYGATSATKRFSFIRCGVTTHVPTVLETTTNTTNGAYNNITITVSPQITIAVANVYWAQFRTGASGDRFYSVEVTYDRP